MLGKSVRYGPPIFRTKLFPLVLFFPSKLTPGINPRKPQKRSAPKFYSNP